MDIEYDNLDDEWINNFEITDKLYEDFYKDDLYYINLRVIYVNRDNEIDKMKHESFLLTNKNNITREEILGILKKNNIILEPDDVKNYLINNNNQNYLSVIKNIDAIQYEKSISMFHDLNDLILIFYEKPKEDIKSEQRNKTKKIYLRPLNTNKKTIKKQYKY